jgi:tRNA(Ile)-lysidine synthase
MNQKDFLRNLNQKNGSIVSKTILIAVSGGIDSMVLLDLMFSSKIQIEVAHCNFCLREKDSDLDQELVEKYCLDRKIKFHSIRFQTKKIATKEGISTQMAARNLRYQWFNQLLISRNIDLLATAHHLYDNIETLLLSFTNGFGSSGLKGIPEQNEKIIRPLLSFTKDDILKYASDNNIIWRDDVSNNGTEYSRNKIRHQVIPVLKEINSGFEKTFSRNLNRLQDLVKIFETKLLDFKKTNVRTIENTLFINSENLFEIEGINLILEEIVKPFGYNFYQILDLLSCIKNRSFGKKIYSDTHIICVERDHFQIKEKGTDEFLEIQFDTFNQEIATSKQVFKIEIIDSIPKQSDYKDINCAYFDKKTLKLPVTIRKWKAGDFFKPFGMTGKQKISDFLINSKLTNSEKDAQLVAISDDSIIWVMRLRTSESHKISKNTNEFVKISILN